MTAEEVALIQAFAELDDEDDEGGFMISDEIDEEVEENVAEIEETEENIEENEDIENIEEEIEEPEATEEALEEELEDTEDEELPWEEAPEEVEEIEEPEATEEALEEELEDTEDEELPWEEAPEEVEEIEDSEEIDEEEIDEDLIPVRVKDEEFRFMDMPIPERRIEEPSTPLYEDEKEPEEETDDEDDLTFDQLDVDENANDGIELRDIPLDEKEDFGSEEIEDNEETADDLTFDQLDTDEANDDEISYIALDLTEKSIEEPIEPIEEALEAEEIAEGTEEIEEIEEIEEAPEEREEFEAIEEIVDEAEEQEKPAVSSADLSLLLQFGCDDEVLEIATGEDIEKLAISDSIGSIEEERTASADYGEFEINDDDLSLDKREVEKDIHQTLEEKVVAIYESYPKKRGAAFLRLLATAFISILLFLYEALPLLGVQLPGIMDRREYFLAYVLIGMQLLVLAMLPSFKQLWGGIKRMFSRSADVYSMLAVISIVTVIYDLFIMTVKVGTPQVFHFMVAMATTAIVGAECARLTQEMNNFKYFFEDVIERAEEDETPDKEIVPEARFTLKKSMGKGSTAEKMYGGGLDPTKKVYVPIEVSSAAGYFNSYDEKSRKSHAPTVLMLPAMVLSLVMGIIAVVVSGGEDIWLGVGTTLISLTVTMPIGVAVTSWLPFEVFNHGCQKQGFSFVNESATEHYSECNVFVFRDMHVFEKCAPKSVNLATYDATSKEVLIGCLGSLYSEIGGPLSSVFSLGSTNENAFGNCRLRRIAKSGVEAVVGANYSVLLGNEQFMARYGISFPGITFKHKGDEIHSLCVSINGRPTARIIVKYSVNEMFEMFAKRLEEDGIYCAIETFDPMISSRLIAKLRGADKPPLSVVHLGIDDLDSSLRTEARPIGEEGTKLGLMAKRSRLNLAVATTSAKKMKDMRKKINLFSFFAALLGAGLAFLFTMLGWMESVNEFVLLLYWFLLSVAFGAIVFTSLPQKERFSLEVFKREESIENMADSILDIAKDK